MTERQNLFKMVTRERKMFHVALRLRLGDLNYNFECYWPFELSNNNLASEVIENRSFFTPMTIRVIEIFVMIIVRNFITVSVKILAIINSQLIVDTAYASNALKKFQS